MPLTNNTKFCGAKSKQNNHRPCMQPCVRNKQRCRMHGGKSTGPKTKEGKLKSARANYKHGMYTNAAIQERAIMRHMMRWRDDLADI